MTDIPAHIFDQRLPCWRAAMSQCVPSNAQVALYLAAGRTSKFAASINSPPASWGVEADVLHAQPGCLSREVSLPGGHSVGWLYARTNSCSIGEEALQGLLTKIGSFIEVDLELASSQVSEIVPSELARTGFGEPSGLHLCTVLDSIVDAVIVTDTAARITYFNPTAQELTGWTAAEALGASLGTVLRSREIDAPESHHPWEAAIGSTQSPVALDLILQPRGGEARRISCSAAPVRADAMRCSGLVLVFRDTTQTYAAEQKLRQSEKLQSIGQLAGGIAHDFNNMLGAIQASSEVLQMVLAASETDAANESMDVILNASRRGAQLTSQLLAFSRQGQLASNKIDLHSVLNDTLDQLSCAADRRLVLARNFAAEQATVIGDMNAIQSMLLGVSVNSSHAMSAGGTISISTRNIALDKSKCLESGFRMEPGRFCEVCIRDDGDGMPADALARVFDPFYTTKSPEKGSGLGLPAAYGTVQDHGGSIDITSEVGVGTEIRVLLPVARDVAEAKLASPGGLSITIGCVLVVDDEAMVRASARMVLNSLGYEVIEAVNGQEAVDIFAQRQGEIDLILLDLNMPVMNGLEAYERLLAVRPDVKVVVASGFVDKRFQEVLSACTVIRKPYSVADLQNAVQIATCEMVA